MTPPPALNVSYESLPTDPKQRHEDLVDAFGQYLFWVRDETLTKMRTLIDSPDAREQLGTMFREAYEQAAQLSDGDKQIAARLAEAAVDSFAALFLVVISGVGFDDPIGPNHVLRFRFAIEICDAHTGEIIEEETINRNGQKFFPQYWGRWLNKFSTRRPG